MANDLLYAFLVCRNFKANFFIVTYYSFFIPHKFFKDFTTLWFLLFAPDNTYRIERHT